MSNEHKEKAPIGFVNLLTLQKWHDEDRFVRPKYQRPVDEERVDDLVKWIKENYNKASYHMQPITVNTYKNKYNIIDGQHRIAAFVKLNASVVKKLNMEKLYITMEFKKVSLEDEKQIFLNINKSKPCARYYLSDDDKKAIIDDIIGQMREEWEPHFKGSRKCRQYHINEENIREILGGNVPGSSTSVLEYFHDVHDIESANDIFDAIYNYNSEIGEILIGTNGYKEYKKIAKSKRSSRKTFNGAIERINEYADESGKDPCYLGMVNLQMSICDIMK